MLDPCPSARRAAVQWTTDAPAWRAAPHSRATASTIGPAAAASSGRAERSPTTPDWISEVTTAQRSGRTSVGEVHGHRGRPYLTPRQGRGGLAAAERTPLRPTPPLVPELRSGPSQPARGKI